SAAARLAAQVGRTRLEAGSPMGNVCPPDRGDRAAAEPATGNIRHPGQDRPPASVVAEAGLAITVAVHHLIADILRRQPTRGHFADAGPWPDCGGPRGPRQVKRAAFRGMSAFGAGLDPLRLRAGQTVGFNESRLE